MINNKKIKVFSNKKEDINIGEIFIAQGDLKKQIKDKYFLNLFFKIKKITKTEKKTYHYYLGKYRKKFLIEFIEYNKRDFFKRYYSNLSLSILFSFKDDLLDIEKAVLLKTGLIHLLAVSGFHIGLFSLFLLGFFRFLKIGNKTGFFLSIIFLLIYVFIVGYRISIIRASILCVLFNFSYIFKKNYFALNSGLLVCLLFLIFEPLNLFDISFLLSFITYFSLVVGFNPVSKLIYNGKNNFFIFLSNWISLSLCPYLASLPLIWYFFKTILISSVIFNIIFMPLFIFIIPIGILSFIFFLLIKPISIFFFVIYNFCLYVIEMLLFLSDKKIYSSFYLDSPSIYFVIFYICVLFIFFSLKKRVYKTAALIFLAGIVLFEFLNIYKRYNYAYINIKNLRQDICFLIKNNNFNNMLILNVKNDYGKNRILLFLKENCVNKIGRLIFLNNSYTNHRLGRLLEKYYKIEKIDFRDDSIEELYNKYFFKNWEIMMNNDFENNFISIENKNIRLILLLSGNNLRKIYEYLESDNRYNFLYLDNKTRPDKTAYRIKKEIFEKIFINYRTNINDERFLNIYNIKNLIFSLKEDKFLLSIN